MAAQYNATFHGDNKEGIQLGTNLGTINAYYYAAKLGIASPHSPPPAFSTNECVF